MSSDGPPLIVLLGGEAGLRCGEIMALEWDDVDFNRRQLCVRRSEWKGQVTAPKSGRHRFVPLTTRLAAALRMHWHLRGRRVLYQDDGSPLTQKVVQDWMRRTARRATVEKAGVHILRHTFCSHLAMRGAPARAIQELAGHQDLATTQRYMHLSPAAIEAAIRLLDNVPVAGGDNGGSGLYRDCELLSVEWFKWWRRRESNSGHDQSHENIEGLGQKPRHRQHKQHREWLKSGSARLAVGALLLAW